jgi:hypothetical protein
VHGDVQSRPRPAANPDPAAFVARAAPPQQRLESQTRGPNRQRAHGYE